MPYIPTSTPTSTPSKTSPSKTTYIPRVPSYIIKSKTYVYVVCGYCHYIMQEGDRSTIFIMHPKTCPVCNSLLDWDNTKDK